MDRSHLSIELIISRDKRFWNCQTDERNTIHLMPQNKWPQIMWWHLPDTNPLRMPMGNRFDLDICERICFYAWADRNVQRYDRQRNFCRCQACRGNSSRAASAISANFSCDFWVPQAMLCSQCVDRINFALNHLSMYPRWTVSSPSCTIRSMRRNFFGKFC